MEEELRERLSDSMDEVIHELDKKRTNIGEITKVFNSLLVRAGELSNTSKKAFLNLFMERALELEYYELCSVLRDIEIRDKEGYDHINLTLDHFKEDLEKIKGYGFNPIAVTQLFFESAFVFETEDEAYEAWAILESQKQEVIGWWYNKEDFQKVVKEYEANNPEIKVKVFWL